MNRFPGALRLAVTVSVISTTLWLFSGCGADGTQMDTFGSDVFDEVGPDVIQADEGGDGEGRDANQPEDGGADTGHADTTHGPDAEKDTGSGSDLSDPDQGGTDLPDPDHGATDGQVVDEGQPSDNGQPSDDGQADATVISCQPESQLPGIKVTVYRDLKDSTTKPANNQSKTDHIQTFSKFDEPWAGIPVNIIDPFDLSGMTCDEGWYRFDPDDGEIFSDGVRILDIGLPECRVTTHNVSRNTPAALAAGRWKMIVMGDSIPVLGTTSGQFFHDNVAADLGPFGDILVFNHAYSGAVTSGWLPTTSNFKNKIKPALADTDVVFVSLGGNDIMHYAYNNMNKPLDQLMDGITQTISSVQQNLRTIFDAIWAENPDVEIVWLIYPNYARSNEWASMVGEQYAPMIESYFEEQMYGIVSWAAGIEGLLLVDLFSRMNKIDLDKSLYDELHYNQYGHRILGNELLKILGGVKIEDGVPTTGGERMIGVICD